MGNAELYDRIIASYKGNGSVKKTAEELRTSVIKVRRVLITEGLWSSATSRTIQDLREQGLDTKQIAEKLHYTKKNVQAFSPYTKGAYGAEEKSSYSLQSRKYRERKQTAADKAVKPSSDVPKEYIREDDLSEFLSRQRDKHPIALKLHLELDLEGCSAQDMGILHKYGKVEKSISRDIIVPADITLHALHYAIQKLFGWQNSHLHHYEFPEQIFKELTGGSFARWCSLAGIYFRFPDEELDDLYWDDDYEPNISFKSWLKSKYKGPYFYGGIGDYYLENQCRVQELKEQLPSFQVRPSFAEFVRNKEKEPQKKIISLEKATIEEFRNSVDLGGDLNHLLERLSLMEYLFLPRNKYFLDSIDEKISSLENGMEENLDQWRTILANIDEQYDPFCELTAFTTVRMQAQSDQINYLYDYGDGWEVSIELTQDYYANDLKGQDGSVIRAVLNGHAPVCVAADGLPVFDDVGGVGGYIDFLTTIHRSEDEEERGQAREWASSLGWTGRAIKPQNLL